MNSLGRKQLIPLALILLFGGCASQPKYAPLNPVPQGQIVYMTISTPQLDAATVESDAEAVGKGAVAGMGGGAAAGASAGLAESVWCGPYIVICAPVLAIVGAGGGAIIGGIGGSVVGAIKGLPQEKASALEAIIATTMKELDVTKTLSAEFSDDNDQYWPISPTVLAPEIAFTVEAIFVDQFSKNELNVHTVTSLVVRYADADPEQTKKILFKFATDKYHVDHWIADDGTNLKNAIYQGLAENMRQAVAVLKGS